MTAASPPSLPVPSHGYAAVCFTIQHHAKFGEVVKVVGADSALGNWDVVAAPTLEWNEVSAWVERAPGRGS